MAFINQGRHIGTVGLVKPDTEGGLITYYGNYKIHTFVECLDFSLLGSQSVLASILLVAGGGGRTNDSGGGAGGMLEYDNFIMNPGNYYVCIGAGGNQERGESSVIHVKGNASTKMTGTISGTAVTIGDAIGGGCHLATTDPNYNTSWPAYPNQYSTQHGGSGGGSYLSGHYGGHYQPPGSGIDTLMYGWSSGNHFGKSGSRVGQGNDGGQGYNSGGATGGGGGGGASANGANAPPFGGNPGEGGSTGGGSGVGGQGGSNSFRTNSAQWYAGGGGGGGGNTSGNSGESAGGQGGGGDPGSSPGAADGDVNTGGGGHGSGSGSSAGAGGSGIIVIRVPEPLIS